MFVFDSNQINIYIFNLFFKPLSKVEIIILQHSKQEKMYLPKLVKDDIVTKLL